MREGINSGRLCANFPLKITHKSVTGDRSKKKEKKKENSRLSEYEAHSSMGILFIYLSILSFTEKVHALVRKLGSDSVKACHLVVTTSAHAHKCDHCVRILRVL